MPETMTVGQSHDLSIELHHKVACACWAVQHWAALHLQQLTVPLAHADRERPTGGASVCAQRLHPPRRA